ncbi:MAG: hypothetical protein QOE29_479 [Gaiellaceae bacterium]|jgi:hypothetical protein|nr:hypothetical protein [Gaiellaceae bacterium]
MSALGFAGLGAKGGRIAGRLFSRSHHDNALASRSHRPAPGDEWLSTVTSLGYGHSGIASLFAVVVYRQGAEMSASGSNARDV